MYYSHHRDEKIFKILGMVLVLVLIYLMLAKVSDFLRLKIQTPEILLLQPCHHRPDRDQVLHYRMYALLCHLLKHYYLGCMLICMPI